MRVYLYLNTPFCGTETPYARAGVVGSPAIPIFQHIATPADQAANEYGTPQYTTHGVICGYCSDDTDLVARVGAVRHASAAHVRACFTAVERAIADHDAEWPLVRAGIL